MGDVDEARFREHSVILNHVSWELHDALGLIAPGAHVFCGDVNEILPEACRLIRAARAAGL